MTVRLGITGHRGLPAKTERLVDAELRAITTRYSGRGLVGYSCLADGADSLFAQAVLDAGGRLVVVVPATRYRDGLPVEHHPTYDRLIAEATEVVRLDRTASDPEAHMAASEYLIDQVDELIAVWDGQPARGFGGTADVVAVARKRNLPVTVVWPAGATRD